jgi:hypothetical protein
VVIGVEDAVARDHERGEERVQEHRSSPQPRPKRHERADERREQQRVRSCPGGRTGSRRNPDQ